MLKIYSFLILLVISFNCVSSDNKECFVKAGEKYLINPVLLYSIAIRESSLNPNAVNARENDKDIGMMQINTFWFPHLKEYGISEKDLFDPCTSIHVGAWVLAQQIKIFGYTWEAVGAYNVGTSKNEKAYKSRSIYAKSVFDIYNRSTTRLQ